MISKKIRPFSRLEIETCSMCNRTCVTCLRNSIPDRKSVSSWFEQNLLPIDDFKRVLEQSVAMGFKGEVCLSHYNEPLMDKRIVEFVRLTREAGFSYIFMGSNADYLTEELAEQLDGLIDNIGFSFYMDDPIRSQRQKWVGGLFKKTKVSLGNGEHMVTHFSPMGDVVQLGRSNKEKPCNLPQKRMIINHKGDMLLCCDDLVGNYDLGNIRDNSLEELWYSEKHQDYVLKLMHAGGRNIHPHCLSCPRG